MAEIEDKTLELLNRLSLERNSLEPADSNGRPIVFIGHSLRGVLVKKAIILAHERSNEPDYKDVLIIRRELRSWGRHTEDRTVPGGVRLWQTS